MSLYGVISPLVVSDLKRAALIFDQLMVRNVDSFLKATRLLHGQIAATEIEWLLHRGVIIEADYEKHFHRQMANALGSLNLFYRSLATFADSQYRSFADTAEAVQASYAVVNELTRVQAVLLRAEGVDAVPLLTGFDRSELEYTEGDVTHVVLRGLPSIDDSVAWEEVLEFRTDERNRLFYRSLRQWIARQVRENIPPHEIVGELELKVAHYTTFLKAQRVASTSGVFEAIVQAGVAGATAGWGIGELAGAVATLGALSVSVRRRRAELLQAELAAPGAELAYLVKAREQFAR